VPERCPLIGRRRWRGGGMAVITQVEGEVYNCRAEELEVGVWILLKGFGALGSACQCRLAEM